jgi:PhnB protein
MELTPYLNFAGQCRQAFTSYAEILGGAVTAELPFPDDDARLIHCRLEVGGLVLHGADALPGEVDRQGMWVSLAVDTVADAQRIFAALSEEGDVRVPMSSTFFASQFGMCVDRFGIPWQVAYIGAASAAA